MSDDDDDWVGTPPEGHYTRDRAKPEFWRSQRPPALIAGAIGIVVLILIDRHPPALTASGTRGGEFLAELDASHVMP